MSWGWTEVPVWSVAQELRRVVEPNSLGPEVAHYSIPSFDATGGATCDLTEEIKSSKLRLSGDEVLISKLNPRKSRVVMVEPCELPIVSSTEFVALRATGIDRRFLSYSLKSGQARQKLDSQVQSVTRSHQRVEPRDITNLSIGLPPHEEQRRIADFLDAETKRIDYLTTLRNQQITALGDRYQTAISECVTPGISKETNRSHIWPWLPEDLEVARLGYFARVQSGVTVDASRSPTEDSAEFPYLRVGNVQGEEIDLSEVKYIRIPKAAAQRSMLTPGDVVMTEANGNPDNLGRGAVWEGSVPNMVHQNHIFAIKTEKDRLTPEYLSSILASAHGRKYFRFTSNQVGIATTSSSKVLAMPIPVTSAAHQEDVAAECIRLRDISGRAVSVLGSQLSLLAERRQALITAAVTGQLDVTTAGRAGQFAAAG